MSEAERTARVRATEPGPCPACGAGVDQSTDPQHLERSVCYCGHPRYWDYRYLLPEGHPDRLG